MNFGNPAEPADARPVEQSLALALVLAATAAMAILHGATDIPLLGDNQHYFYMAERTAAGFSPHDCHFEPKTSLCVLLSGAAIRVGRLAGVSAVVAPRILSWLILALTVWAVWRLARWLTRSRAAAGLALLAMFGFEAYVYQGLMGFQPKVFMALPVTLMLLFQARRRYFAVGLAAGFAFISWQPTLLMFVILLAVTCFHRERMRWIGLALAGAALPVGAYQLFFLLVGSIENQLIQNFYFPAMHMASNFRGPVGALLRLVELWNRGFGVFNVLPLLAGVGLGGYAVTRLRGRGRGGVPSGTQHAWVCFVACAIGGLAFTYYDQQGVPDLFLLLPFIAIVAGHAMGVAARYAGRGRPAILGAAAVYLLVLAGAGGWRAAERVDFDLADQRRVATRVGAMLETGEGVYAVGCTHLLGFNHAPNWLRFGLLFRGSHAYIRASTGCANFSPEKDGRWPGVILISRMSRRHADELTGSRYAESPEPEFRQQGIRVFRRR